MTFRHQADGKIEVMAPPEWEPIASLLFGIEHMKPIIDLMVEYARNPAEEPRAVGGGQEYWVVIDKDKAVIRSDFSNASVTLPRVEFLLIIEEFAKRVERL
ncbi:hypothetical protein AB0J55_44975 [Amycolatopsis sp. NPDC049688]|uniref:hypothetical protein n=1 Tax=Amycolatopsis sp. NPDC049688 TaxID=3154733 RepID=UPI00342CC3B8